MELTQTDVVFSRTTMVLFFVQKKSSPNAKKLFDDFFGNKIGTRSFMGGPEGEGGGHYPPGHARGLGCVLVGSGPLEAHLSMRLTPKNPINT
jgi:hypothetical protein